jgi:hypothetical protein
MNKNFIKLFALGFGAITFFGCQEEEDALIFNDADNKFAHEANCDVINFEQYNTGFRTQVQSAKGIGPIMVMNKARNSSGTIVDENRAMIFDMANPTGDDTDDLFHPDLGKGLIINQLNTTIPNDNQWGGFMMLDFSAIGPVDIRRMTVVDIDLYEDESYIRLYNNSGTMIKEHKLIPMGNGSVQIAELNTTNVMKVEVILAGTVARNGHVGSGAIDNIEYCVTPTVGTRGCTKTQGYWKTHGDPQNQKKYDATWDPYVNTTFFKSGMTYMQILNEPVKGRAYLILAHQYIAARLNLATGASMPANVKSAYDGATNYFENNNMNNDLMRSQLTTWADMLAAYNEGKMGPGHCN